MQKAMPGTNRLSQLNSARHGGFSMSNLTLSKKIQTCRSASFAGLDYHKKKTHITFGDESGDVIGVLHIVNDKEVIRKVFTEHPNVVCAIESCRGYEWLLELLQQEFGLTVHLVNTNQAKLITQSKRKTDKLDSKAIMQLLAKDFLPTCYQPTPDERRLRERLRWRAHLVRNTTRMKVRIHSLIDKENLGSGLSTPFSEAGKARIRELPLSPARRQLVLEHLEMLDYFESLVAKEDKWVKETVRLYPNAQLLATIPGIGALSALIIMAEIGDYSRFRNASRVASYFGVVPRISSSADRRYVGPITKTGSKLVRSILVQCAWIAITKSPQLMLHFRSVSRRCGRNGAIISVARKLIKIAFSMLKNQKPFTTDMIGNNCPN